MKKLFHGIHQFFFSGFSRQVEATRALSNAGDLVELEQLQRRMAQKL